MGFGLIENKIVTGILIILNYIFIKVLHLWISKEKKN